MTDLTVLWQEGILEKMIFHEARLELCNLRQLLLNYWSTSVETEQRAKANFGIRQLRIGEIAVHYFRQIGFSGCELDANYGHDLEFHFEEQTRQVIEFSSTETPQLSAFKLEIEKVKGMRFMKLFYDQNFVIHELRYDRTWLHAIASHHEMRLTRQIANNISLEIIKERFSRQHIDFSDIEQRFQYGLEPQNLGANYAKFSMLRIRVADDLSDDDSASDPDDED